MSPFGIYFTNKLACILLFHTRCMHRTKMLYSIVNKGLITKIYYYTI